MSRCTHFRLIVSLAFAAVFLAAGGAHAQSEKQIQACSKRIAKAFKRFSTEAMKTFGDCEVDSLKDDQRNDCAADEGVWGDLKDVADRLRREVKKCDADAFRAVCPHSSRDDDELKDQVLNDPNGTASRLATLDAEIYALPYPGCPEPRPTGEISRDAQNCVDRMSRLTGDGLDELQKCLYKCELGRMRESGQGPCIDGGNPVNQKVIECLDGLVQDLEDGLSARCDSALVTELGCPLSQTTVSDLATALQARLFEEVEKMSSGIFQSSCSSGGGSSPKGGTTDPVPVTLYPSETPTQIDCGQTLDAAFFGADNELRLDGDFDCSPAGLGSIAVIISASDVTLSGRSKWEVVGPARSSNRTGPGILIAPGAKNVTIKSFAKIQRYAVGIADSGDNDGLRIEDLTVRRNKTAGIATTSPNVVVDGVKADRNGIGFEMSGDGSTIQDSRALRSTPLPGIGIHLLGTDDDGNGRVVRVNRCDVEENQVGIAVAVGPHLLEDNDVRMNFGDGIVVSSDGSKIDSNSVKLNSGDGIVVQGDANNVTANRSDENTGHGFVVTGSDNNINNNGAGSLTDRGNLLDGYWLNGANNIVEDNDAQANLGSGFVVDEVTARVKSNLAKKNTGTGFDVNAPGNGLNTNVADDNGGPEFSLVAGTIDDGGNRKNGSSFSFTLSGGNFE